MTKKIFLYLIGGIFFFQACKTPGSDLPAPAQNVQQVKDFLKQKSFTSTKAGMYDNLSVNGKKDINWIDTTDKKNEMMARAGAEEIGLKYQFINDSAVLVTKAKKDIPGTYKVDEETDETSKEDPGIKLRITFPDPEFMFNGEVSNVTYTLNVLGCEKDKLLLQTARKINGAKVLALFEEKK